MDRFIQRYKIIIVCPAQSDSLSSLPLLSQKAVQLLHKMGQADGSFLVRPNSRRPGYYALTLIYNQMPYHYEIVSEVCYIYSPSIYLHFQIVSHT